MLSLQDVNETYEIARDINKTDKIDILLDYQWTDGLTSPYCLGLLDPTWIKERQKSMKERQDQDEVYAAGSSIEDSLKRLSERRTDIFGVGIEETQIGKKVRNMSTYIY